MAEVIRGLKVFGATVVYAGNEYYTVQIRLRAGNAEPWCDDVFVWAAFTRTPDGDLDEIVGYGLNVDDKVVIDRDDRDPGTPIPGEVGCDVRIPSLAAAVSPPLTRLQKVNDWLRRRLDRRYRRTIDASVRVVAPMVRCLHARDVEFAEAIEAVLTSRFRRDCESWADSVG